MSALKGPGRDDEPVVTAAAAAARVRGLCVSLAQASPSGQHLLATLRRLSEMELRTLYECWPVWAHDGQLPPGPDVRLWLIRAGRGFGKTRAGAEWVSDIARTTPGARIALVGGTVDDVRKVMVEGASGLIAVMRHGERYAWKRDAGEFEFDSGARAFVYSAAAPEALRGPEHHAAWCDELAKWRYGDAAWDNLRMGLRLGAAPRVLVTTTPRPTMLMRRVMATPGRAETRGTTGDNPHLPASFVRDMHDIYAGTRLGRQELDGELIEDADGALWTRAILATQRVAEAPDLVRVVVGVDPPAGVDGDACGIVAVGLDGKGHAYVIEDASVAGQSPEGWAEAVAACAGRVGADRVIAEKNQGGEMVRAVLNAADGVLPITLVHASRGKVARAEPVAALYERGKVWHAGIFQALEDELCGLIAGGSYQGPGRSPDRADACVWAISALLLGKRGRIGVRALDGCEV